MQDRVSRVHSVISLGGASCTTQTMMPDRILNSCDRRMRSP